jgi:hypothetical protein
MNQRERIMVLVLAVLALGGAGFAAFTFGVKPILAKKKELQDLTVEVEVKHDQQQKVARENKKRLDEYNLRSLPPNMEFSRREYQSLLYKTLEQAHAPNSVTVSWDAAKANPAGIPQLYPEDKKDKTPIYTKVAYKIEMKKVDLGIVTDFLKRYYDLNLLHQITFFEIKREGSVDLGQDKRHWEQRDDLTVTIVTEGMMLNGAPARNTLLPVSPSYGAVVGGYAWYGMGQSTRIGQQLGAHPFEQVTSKRNFYDLAARDPFHGSLYDPPPPKIEAIAEPPPPPPKPDYSEFIQYTMGIKTTEGNEHTARVTIRDKINNEDYELELMQIGEKLNVVVRKFWFIGGKKQTPTRSDMLEISHTSMSNKHKFKVYGLDGDSLILGEKPSGLAELTKAAGGSGSGFGGPGGGFGGPGAGGGGRGGGRGGPSVRTPLPPADPQAAILGGYGAVTAPRPEKIYRWKDGDTLNKIVELKDKEAEKAIQRAQSSLISTAESATDPMAVADK